MTLETDLRFGVKPRFKPKTSDYETTKIRSQVVNENHIGGSAEDILFETILHLHEQGKIKINDEEILSESILGLLRTGVITINTAKGMSASKKMQQRTRELKSDATDISRAKTPEDAQKRISDAFKTLSEVLEHLEEMQRRNLYVSASSGLFSDRTYSLLKKIQKGSRRR